MNNKIKYPILSFKKEDNFLYFVSQEKELLTTTESILNDGVFEGFTFVDSDGFVYQFKKAKKIGYAGFFGINPLLKEWWKDREIKIEMEFEPNIKKIELIVLKEIVLEKVEKSKQFWKEAWDIKELKNAINEAKTFKELIMLLK